MFTCMCVAAEYRKEKGCKRQAKAATKLYSNNALLKNKNVKKKKQKKTSLRPEIYLQLNSWTYDGCHVLV